jgi:hypothetical protein
VQSLVLRVFESKLGMSREGVRVMPMSVGRSPRGSFVGGQSPVVRRGSAGLK